MYKFSFKSQFYRRTDQPPQTIILLAREKPFFTYFKSTTSPAENHFLVQNSQRRPSPSSFLLFAEEQQVQQVIYGNYHQSHFYGRDKIFISSAVESMMQRATTHTHSTANLKSVGSEAQINSILMRLLTMRESMIDTAQSAGLDWSTRKVQEESTDSLDELLDLSEDLEKLWRVLMENVAMQRSELFQLKSYSRVNEEYLLYSYKTLVSLTDGLSQFSKLLHESTYPLELYKSFRKMYEYVSTLSTAMHKYRSLNGDFTDAKQGYINDQLGLLESVQTDSHHNSKFSTIATDDQTNKQFRLALEKMGPPKQQPCPGQRPPIQQSPPASNQLPPPQQPSQTSQLKLQISRLQELLQQNNDEFAVEIEKYNRILYEQQDELKACEYKFKRMEGRLEELENLNVRMREEKIRDDLLIEYVLKIFRNMSRKLRVYEKESGYLSPGHSRGDSRHASKSRLLQKQPVPAAYPRLRSEFAHTYLS